MNKDELEKMLKIAVQNSIEYFVIDNDKEFMAKIPKLRQAYVEIVALIKSGKPQEVKK